MDMIYNVFRTEDPQAILDHLVVGDIGCTGLKLVSSIYSQHFKVDSGMMIQLEPVEVQDLLDRELAWTFFRDHSADHDSLNREIATIMEQLKIDNNKAIDLYASWVYENASARARMDLLP